MTYDLIIFDCDGTLVDSETLNNYACAQILDDAGFGEYTAQDVSDRFTGHKISGIFKIIEQESGRAMPDDMVERFLTAVQSNARRFLKPDTDILETVGFLEPHAKLCVGSNGEIKNILLSLSLTTLDRYFPDDIVFSAGLVGKGKPAPDLFLHAASKMKAAPEKCLVVEDSQAGVQAAVAAGMKVIGVTHFHHEPDMLKQRLLSAGANDIIGDFKDLRKIVSF